MKLLSNMFLVVLVVLASLTGCASLFGEGWNPADASAQADGGGHDGSTVGETDVGGKTDTTSVDSQTDSSDAVGQDGGTDVAVLSCPSGKAETLLNGMQKSSCCSIVEVEAYELLSTHKAVPATNCQTMDSDYCLPLFAFLTPTDSNTCSRVKMWFEQNKKVTYTFDLDHCDMTKVCSPQILEPNGDKAEFVLDIKKKLLTQHNSNSEALVETLYYKLVPK